MFEELQQKMFNDFSNENKSYIEEIKNLIKKQHSEAKKNMSSYVSFTNEDYKSIFSHIPNFQIDPYNSHFMLKNDYFYIDFDRTLLVTQDNPLMAFIIFGKDHQHPTSLKIYNQEVYSNITGCSIISELFVKDHTKVKVFNLEVISKEDKDLTVYSDRLFTFSLYPDFLIPTLIDNLHLNEKDCKELLFLSNDFDMNNDPIINNIYSILKFSYDIIQEKNIKLKNKFNI